MDELDRNLLQKVSRLLESHMILAQDHNALANSQLQTLEKHIQSNKVVGDCLMESNAILQVIGEELRADRQADRYAFNNAVRLLETATKTLNTVNSTLNKKLDAIQKNTYDAFTAAEALRGQLEQPLSQAAASAKDGAKAAADGAAHAKETAESVKKTMTVVQESVIVVTESAAVVKESAAQTQKANADLTGKIETIADDIETLTDGKDKKFKVYIDFFKSFSEIFKELPLSTRILFTILAVVFVGGAVYAYVAHLTSSN